MNSAFSAWDRTLADGDEVVFIPPWPADERFEFTQAPIDATPLAAPLAQPAAGGFASFEGRVRETTKAAG